MKAKLQILIPTVVTRDREFKRLVDILRPQVEKLKGGVRVLVYWNNFEHPLGDIRQRMQETATADYIVFIDDDDTVPDYFCEEIYPLLDGVDHIGYEIEFRRNGQKQLPVYHSIKCKGYYDDSTGFYRQVTPKDPIKRELSLKGDYSRADYTIGLGEETVWMEDMEGLVKTENYIDKVMYYYDQREGEGVFARTQPEDGDFIAPSLPKYFEYMDWMK